MKLSNNIKVFVMGAWVLLSACDPIEDRDELKNSYTPDDIELEVIQSTQGGNGLTIKMNTPGVIGFWDYNINESYTDEVQVNYPIPGKATFTYNIATAYMPNGNPSETEYISKTVDVQIDVLDQPLPQAYYDLVGDDLEGKTWVFDGVPADGGLWWYMSPGDDPSSYGTAWWNAGGSGDAPPVDVSGEMTFDLDGAANYTYKEAPDATGVLGGFAFNSDYSKFIVKGDQKILGNEEPRGNPDGEYTLISLTSDQMILYVPMNSGGTGWTWVFKPKE
ncbi:hypothetical protein [Reichenbachiella sp. 5M10]|uniref:hypothetical protein n=1 Tax=Reichenbachiella sp. 5M10 TaxID=1889772 RepID=UPI000C157B97|nr:hypothetical protein [Reichenbachiella sp. 5M10]